MPLHRRHDRPPLRRAITATSPAAAQRAHRPAWSTTQRVVLPADPASCCPAPPHPGRRHVTADNSLSQVDLEALAAEVTVFLEQVPVGEGIGIKLSRLLLGFLQTEVLPE